MATPPPTPIQSTTLTPDSIWEEFVQAVGPPHNAEQILRWDKEALEEELAEQKWTGKKKGAVQAYWKDHQALSGSFSVGKIALFKKLLQEQAINPQERVVARAVELFSNSLNILSENDGRIAVKFYDRAKMYPPTSSRIALHSQGIDVDGTFAPATCAELLWAFKNNTHPYVFKIPELPSAAHHEYNVWQQLTNQALTHNLVGPIELQHFRSADRDSVGILVPVFATSLDRSPKPFQQRPVLIIGRTIESALRYMHSRQVFHCDVKAGNIFLDRQGTAHLGDYGSCVIGGGVPHECSLATHWPADLPYQTTAMTPAIDFLLLTVTLLDLLGVITLDGSTGALTREEIKTKVQNLEASEFKSFLMALNNYSV